MNDLVAEFAVFVLGAVGVAMVSRSYTAREKQWIVWALVLRLAACNALLWITFSAYGSADFVLYQQIGSLLADDASFFDILKLFLQVDGPLDWVFGAGSSTGTMHATSALCQSMFGHTLYGMAMLGTVVSFLGELAMYDIMRRRVQSGLRAVFGCILYVPSVVFWSSGFVKEAFAMGGLGLLVHGTLSLLGKARQPVPHILAVLAGLLLVGLFKAYIIIAFGCGVAMAYSVARWLTRKGNARVVLAPFYMGTAMLLVVALAWTAEGFTPRYSLENLPEEAASLQGYGRQTVGGSNIDFGEPEQDDVGGQAALAPLALVNSLLRPSLLDVRSPLMAISALEMTALTLALLSVLLNGRRSLRRMRALATNSEWVFAVTFTLVLGVGVGLTSTNLGTLARYRMPLMPFYVLAMLYLVRPPAGVVRQALAGTRVRRPPTRNLPPVPRPTPAGQVPWPGRLLVPPPPAPLGLAGRPRHPGRV